MFTRKINAQVPQPYPSIYSAFVFSQIALKIVVLLSIYSYNEGK